MLLGWKHMLGHVVADMADLKPIPKVRAFISKVRKVVAKFTRLTRLLKEVKSLLKLVSSCFSLFWFSLMKAMLWQRPMHFKHLSPGRA